jgi:pyruvate dehydrogenase E2 component (dihydrolipoamide acetyltransferase)
MHEIRIPRLGWSMEEGTFVGWLKRAGDEVAVGQPLFELEGEKALQEIESVDAGVLHIPADAPQPGSIVPVGTLLGYLLAPGESIPTGNSSPPQDSASPAKPSTTIESVAAAPSVRRLARELGVNLNELAASGISGRITTDDVRRVAGPSPVETLPRAEKPIATPRARRIAAERGIDWTRLRGTGRNGRIRESDVRAASQSGNAVAAMSPRRKAIADKLRVSRDRTIPVTLTTTADAANLWELREQFKASQAQAVPSWTDIIACLAARVLERFPAMAARWSHDHAALIPVAPSEFGIGIAVDTPDGLLVPVVQNIRQMSLMAVVAESRRLVESARGGRLTAADMQGGVFTISNLGASGIDGFTPIINYPEISILGLGAIRREPVVMPDDTIAPRHRMTLSLTFDHAAIDGAPAAEFLNELASAIRNPAAQLLDQ